MNNWQKLTMKQLRQFLKMGHGEEEENTDGDGGMLEKDLGFGDGDGEGMTESERILRQNIVDSAQMSQRVKSRRGSLVHEHAKNTSVMAFDGREHGKITKYTTRGKEGFDINYTSSGLSKQLQLQESANKKSTSPSS